MIMKMILNPSFPEAQDRFRSGADTIACQGISINLLCKKSSTISYYSSSMNPTTLVLKCLAFTKKDMRKHKI